MRIDRLWLEEYRNLIQFEIDFDETSSRQVVVGRNGVGKSNLLEALTWIFRDLDLELPSEFAYEIEYICNDHFVKIRCHAPDNPADPCLTGEAIDRQISVSIATVADCNNNLLHNDRPYQPLTVREFFRRNRPIHNSPNPDRLLPTYVFGYYSGEITRFSKIFETHEERYYRDQIRGDEAPLRSLFLAKPHHSQFALMAFYATHDESAKSFLEREFRISGFSSALFALREPYWKPSRGSERPGDPRFWHAGGNVAPFLDALFESSFAPMAARERSKISVSQEKTRERRFCFIPDEESLRDLAEGLSNKEFFARLESLVFSDLVGDDGKDVRIWVTLKGTPARATFNDLAEGERQLLTILGLMRFTAEDEALFLLDEPDTHLNPAWCLDYLEHLRTYGAEPANSQVIMTTHSPLTFAGLERNEVVILERSVDNHIYAEHPTSAPRGMGFAAILTSEFFGLRSTLDRSTLAMIDRRRALASKVDRTDEERMDLAELTDALGKLDFSQAARDPLYLEYIRAMTAVQEQQPELKVPAPSKATWRQRQQIAEDVAQRLLKGRS